MSCCVHHNNPSDVSLDSLMRFVAPYAGIPHNMGMDLLRQAYTEFARRSSILVSEQRIKLQRGVCEYRLEAPEGYEVFALKVSGVGVPPWNFVYPSTDNWFFHWGCRMRMEGNEWLVLRDPPSHDSCEGEERCIQLAILPSPCCDTIPSELATPYGKGIAAGARAEALLIAGKTWYDPRGARRAEIEFNRTTMAAKNLQLTNRGTLAPMFKPVRIL